MGYVLAVVGAQVTNRELAARLAELDLDKNGFFTSGETTPEVHRRMLAVANDTGRTLAPFTGLPLSAIWSAVNLGFISLGVRIVRGFRRNVRPGGSA